MPFDLQRVDLQHGQIADLAVHIRHIYDRIDHAHMAQERCTAPH